MSSIILMCLLVPLFLYSSIQKIENHFLSNDIIKIVALHLLKDDIKNVVSNNPKTLFEVYYYFLKKGYFDFDYAHPQSFNILFFINKKFYNVVSSIPYEDKLRLWFEERVIINDLFYELTLFQKLILSKNILNKSDLKVIISYAWNFFAHPDFFEPISDNYAKSNHGLKIILPRGSCAHPVELNKNYNQTMFLMDYPYIFFIFYMNMYNYYIKKGNSFSERVFLHMIRRSTQFGNTSNFDMPWFKKFISLSKRLFNNGFSKKYFFAPIVKQHKERKVNSETKYCLKKAFVDLIDHYSKLNIDLSMYLQCKWYNKEILNMLDDNQKIMWFYYTHTIHLKTLQSGLISFLFVQDLLFEIQEWLQGKYPDTVFILSDELISKFKDCSSKFWMRIFRLLDYVVKDAKKNNIFNPNLLFDSLRFIFNSNKDLILKKRDKNITKKAFYSCMTKEFFNHINNVVRIQAFTRRYNALSLKFNYQASAQSFKDVIFEKKIKILNFLNKVTSYKKYFFMGIFLSISGILFYWLRRAYVRFII